MHENRVIRRTWVNQPWSPRPLERLQVTSLRGAVGAAAAIVLISRVRDVPWRNSKGCWREGADGECRLLNLGYFEMTRCLGCDQCLGCDTQSQWHFLTPTVLPAILEVRHLPRLVLDKVWNFQGLGMQVFWTETWRVCRLDTLVRLLSLHFAYLISPRFFQSCTNQQHLDVFARIPNHSLYWMFHLSASTFIKSTGLSNSESSNPGFFDCHLWSLGCNRFGCKKFDRDGGLAKQLVAMDLRIFDRSFLNQVYKYVRIVRILRTCLHDSRRRHL